MSFRDRSLLTSRTSVSTIDDQNSKERPNDAKGEQRPRKKIDWKTEGSVFKNTLEVREMTLKNTSHLKHHEAKSCFILWLESVGVRRWTLQFRKWVKSVRHSSFKCQSVPHYSQWNNIEMNIRTKQRKHDFVMTSRHTDTEWRDLRWCLSTLILWWMKAIFGSLRVRVRFEKSRTRINKLSRRRALCRIEVASMQIVRLTRSSKWS